MEVGYIYRYLLNDETVYVGQTRDLDKRIQQHSKEIQFFGLTQIQFKGCLTKELDDVEAYFIDLYKPILNQRHPTIKNENIEKIINNLFDWEDYKKPIPVILPLVELNASPLIENYVIQKGEPSGKLIYATGLPVNHNLLPLENKYYTFGKGKNKFECILLDDFDKQMNLIRKNFITEVERVANDILKEHPDFKEIHIQK